METPDVLDRLRQEFPKAGEALDRCVALLKEGAPLPFIIRYRAHETGSLGEGDIRRIAERQEILEELERRRRSILRILESVPGKLTPEIQKAIEATPDLQTLEDLFAPLRPKKIEEVNQAIHKGLDPLADWIANKDTSGKSLEERAKEFVDEEKGVKSPQEALEGARRLLIERYFDNPEIRRQLRLLIREKGQLVADAVEGAGEAAQKYKSYLGHKEALLSIPSHRMLALRRAEREKAVKLRIEFDEEAFLAELTKGALEGLAEDEAAKPWREFLAGVVKEAFRRLRERCTTDVRLEVKDRSDRQSIQVAERNLRQILSAPPFGRRPVLSIDVGARSAALVFVGGDGTPEDPLVMNVGFAEETQSFLDQVKKIVEEKGVQGITLGGAQQARQILTYLRGAARDWRNRVDIVFWPDNIAETYAGSKSAKAEFLKKDKGTRGAIFMARRLQDPLRELAKLEPRSLGVGQYQQDVARHRLNMTLHGSVQNAICRVGVNPNTDSVWMIGFLPGLNEELAQKIVADREKKGPFKSKEDLKRVEGLDDKSFSYAAGFLRISGTENPLDRTGVHPEHYPIAEKIRIAAANAEFKDLVGSPRALGMLDAKAIAGEEGDPLLVHMVIEQMSYTRDPRGKFRGVQFRDDVQKAEDLQPNMVLEGVVSNVTNFGAFVDIGLDQDGLVHISELADRFIKMPHEIVRVGQVVRASVLKVDPETKKISLSMKAKALAESKPAPRQRRESKPPVLVRAATARRDGLGGMKKERKGGRRDRKDGDRGGRGGGDRDRGRGGDRGDRGGRRERGPGRSGGGPSRGRREEAVQRNPLKSQGTGFVNNPFKSFFAKTDSKEEEKSDQAKEPEKK